MEVLLVFGTLKKSLEFKGFFGLFVEQILSLNFLCDSGQAGQTGSDRASVNIVQILRQKNLLMLSFAKQNYTSFGRSETSQLATLFSRCVKNKTIAK